MQQAPDHIKRDRRYAAASDIVGRLQSAGYQAFFAGGCVRDMLLGTLPGDYDIATSAVPGRVEELFDNTKPVGRRFGVILVMSEGLCFEVATFRSETGYSDGRRPDSVRFAAISEDALRRDFTINGMYYDPGSGRLIDTVGGRRDLKDRILRTIGSPRERFGEDHLRIIRAVRFAARLDMEMEQETQKAAGEMSHHLCKVAPERLSEELRIILTDRAPAVALRMMDRLGILDVIFPELTPCRGCSQPKNYHPEGDVFTHTILTVEKLGPHPDFEVAMAALLHDAGKPEACRRTPERFPEHERIGSVIAGAVCRRLRLTGKETGRIVWLVKRHMYFKDAEKMKKSTLRRLFAEDGFEQLCLLVYADAMASWGRTDHLDYVLEKRAELAEAEIKPEPLISGHDLLDMGCRPGPALGKILDRIYEMQLEGEITTRSEALAAAEEYAGNRTQADG